MKIKRDYYLNKIIKRKDNGLIKIITGMRRCGKSYLLFELYYQYLLDQGIDKDLIMRLPLDELSNARYRNPFELDSYVRNFVKDNDKRYYIFIDEIQFVKEIENPWLKGTGEMVGFVDILLGLMKLPNVDIYITGSNSKMLSSEIVTQFRDRGDEIKLYPFSFSEICRIYNGDQDEAWKEYINYGGLPRVYEFEERKDRAAYLSNLFESTYIKDILEKHNIRNDKKIIDELIRIIASSVGSLTNPRNISNTFESLEKVSINQNTVDNYLDYFVDAFLINKSFRYDVKGRKYINTPLKYYFTDIGFRNALLGFRQQEENHIMENIIYMELVRRGYSVDVGSVTYRHYNESGESVRTQLEVDFIARNNGQQIYIQSALNIDNDEKRLQETSSLEKINDHFKKIIVVKDDIIPWVDAKGIYYVGVKEFLSGNYPDMELI